MSKDPTPSRIYTMSMGLTTSKGYTLSRVTGGLRVTHSSEHN